MSISRKVFFGRLAASLAAVAGAASRAEAQLVYRRSDWNIKDFDALLHAPGRVRQVYDVSAIGGGKFLNNIKNSLNGLHFGFDIPAPEIRIVAALHGPANLINYDDSIWAKYRVGEWLQVTDPATGRPAARNIFYPSKAGAQLRYASEDPDQENSRYQDTSVAGLQARGVKFLSCHTATEEQARLLIHQWNLPQKREEIAKDMLSHTQPGVLVVPSMVASVALLESEGRYSYITV